MTCAHHAAGLELGHRGQHRDVRAVEVFLEGAVEQRAHQLDLGAQLGEPKWITWLSISGWPNVLRSRVYSIVSSISRSMPRTADDRAAQPLLLELQHLHHEAHALLADAIALRHAHVVEEDLAVSLARMPSLSSFVPICTPLVFVGTQISDLFLWTGAFAGVGEQAQPVGLRAVGDPHLAAVDHVVAAVPARAWS